MTEEFDDVKNDPNQPAAPLERRALGGARRGTPGADNSPSIIAQDAVMALVLKHCQRYSRDGRPFSIASLDILEYEHVRDVIGQAAADQLERLVRLVSTNTFRGSDRLCVFEPGHLIVLLPDTDSQAAKAVMQRITQSIASARLSYKNKPLRASGAFLIASCGVSERHADREGMPVPDAEALLEAIGYRFDEFGNLFHTQLSSMRLFTRKKSTFSGSFSVWSDRYVDIKPISTHTEASDPGLPPGLVLIRATASDQWQAGQTVNIKMIEPVGKGAKFNTDALALVARRARVLQQIDHPGLWKLIDYHAYEQRHLYLVQNVLEGEPLSNVQAELGQALSWGIQLCNSLIYLQGLIPPLIPPRLQQDNFYVSADSQLIISDYEIPYVMGPLTVQGDAEKAEPSQDLYSRFHMEDLIFYLRLLMVRAGQPDSYLDNILKMDSKEQHSENFNTVFKVRSELKSVLDNLNLPSVR